jgi:hypothetical protein
MKKLVSLFGILALVVAIAPFVFNSNVAYAAPGGTLTGTAITVNIGEIKPINTLTVTAPGTSDITSANDIYIKIPAGVNAYWDVADATPTFGGGASAKVAASVTYPDEKTLKIDVTTDFANNDTLTIADLSYIGYGAASTAAALTWSVDGGVTYGSADATTNITVASGTQDTLTGVSATLSNNVVSSTNVSYTVNFTVPTGGVIPKNGKIKVTFPAGFNVAGAGAGTPTGIDGTVTASVAGQDVTLTRNNDGTNSTAGAKAVVITGITNHATADSTYTFNVTTHTSASDLLATAASSAFSVNPAAITNLTCEPSGQGGAVWLRWTVPAGTSGGYEMKYQQGNSITYGSATAFTQTWPAGTVGTAQQQLLTGLNPNTQYTFAAKAKGAGSSISAISSLTPTCYAPGGAHVAADSTAPVTRITSPAFNSTVAAGKPLLIKGTSLDSGGSSVQKVEVSLDGGNNWNLATVTDNVDGNIIWQYTWANAQAGKVTIMARATDWVGNTETPGASVAVTVLTAPPTVSVEVGGPATTTTTTTTPATTTTTTSSAAAVISAMPYANPVGADQIKADITYLQTQLISLLQQLLAALQAQAAGH